MFVLPKLGIQPDKELNIVPGWIGPQARFCRSGQRVGHGARLLITARNSQGKGARL